MCYKKPGPRCSYHAKQNLKATSKAVRSNPTAENVEKHTDAQMAYDATKAGMEALQAKIAEATLRHGEESDLKLNLQLRLFAAEARKNEAMAKHLATYGKPTSDAKSTKAKKAPQDLPQGTQTLDPEASAGLLAAIEQAPALDDAGLDVLDSHGTLVLRGVAKGDARSMNETARLLQNEYNSTARLRLDHDEERIGSFNQAIAEKKVGHSGQPREISNISATRAKNLMEAAGMLGDSGWDTTDLHGVHIARSLLQGDETEAHKEMDLLEGALRRQGNDARGWKSSEHEQKFNELLSAPTSKA